MQLLCPLNRSRSRRSRRGNEAQIIPPPMKPVIRHVCFDLDNTLVDDTGRHFRPGMRQLLDSLKANGITVSLWTASCTERGWEILKHHGLEDYFAHCICREDYDPEENWEPKDISRINADLLVDDWLQHIEYVIKSGRQGFLITPFCNPEEPTSLEELQQLQALILIQR